jgi:hypothetical protein
MADPIPDRLSINTVVTSVVAVGLFLGNIIKGKVESAKNEAHRAAIIAACIAWVSLGLCVASNPVLRI